MICFSSDVPEEYVDAIVDAHCSEYHGMFSFCDVELMETKRIYLTLVTNSWFYFRWVNIKRIAAEFPISIPSFAAFLAEIDRSCETHLYK